MGNSCLLIVDGWWAVMERGQELDVYLYRHVMVQQLVLPISLLSVWGTCCVVKLARQHVVSLLIFCG